MYNWRVWLNTYIVFWVKKSFKKKLILLRLIVDIIKLRWIQLR